MKYDMEEILDELSDFTTDLQDAFSESLEKLPMALEMYPGVKDGYFRSYLIRAGVKSALLTRDYKMANVANTGLEIDHQGFGIKIVRSCHSGGAPAPTTVTRASWCMANQPRLYCDGITPADIWEVGRLRLPGANSEQIVARVLEQQHDGLTHLLVDWEEIRSEGIVRLSISMPMGAWAPGETPKVAWRFELKDDALGADRFVPSDEPFNVFSDDDDDASGMEVVVG